MGILSAAALPAIGAVPESSDVIRVVVCTNPPDRPAQTQAGRVACGADRRRGAWIRPEASVAPATAPANHDGLTRARTVASRGVRVTEDGHVIAIDQRPEQLRPTDRRARNGPRGTRASPRWKTVWRSGRDLAAIHQGERAHHTPQEGQTPGQRDG